MPTPTEKEPKLPKSPFPYWARFTLISPLRRLYANRRKIVGEAGIAPGMTVLELGCGPGFFTDYLARQAGAAGRVVAQDVQPQMLASLRARMRRFPVSENIEPLLADSAALGLPDNSVDAVFAANVFEEIHKEGGLTATAAELARVLKTGGTLFFKEHRSGVGRRVIDTVFAALARAGLKLVAEKKTAFSYRAWFRKEAA